MNAKNSDFLKRLTWGGFFAVVCFLISLIIYGCSHGWFHPHEKPKYLRYNLAIHVEQFTNTEEMKAEIERVVSPEELRRYEYQGTDPQDQGMAKKVVISRLGAAGRSLEHVDEPGVFQKLLGGPPTKSRFDRRWHRFLVEEGGGSALDNLLAETVAEATLKSASEECAKEIGSNCVFMLDEDCESGTTQADFGGMRIVVVGDIKSLQNAIREFLRSAKKTAPPWPTVHVILHGRSHQQRFEVLVPKVTDKKTGASGLPDGAAESLAALVAANVDKKPAVETGVSRDDKPDERLIAATGAEFWKSQPMRDMLGRDYEPNADPEAGVKKFLANMESSASDVRVFGLVLPPTDETEMTQTMERTIRKYGGRDIEFYPHDDPALEKQIAEATGKGNSIALIVRPAPKRPKDRGVVKGPVSLLSDPAPNAAPVRITDTHWPIIIIPTLILGIWCLIARAAWCRHILKACRWIVDFVAENASIIVGVIIGIVLLAGLVYFIAVFFFAWIIHVVRLPENRCYDLVIHVEQFTDARKIRGEIDKVVTPVELTGIHTNYIPTKVVVSRLGTVGNALEYVYSEGFFSILMRAPVTKARYDKRWLDFLEKKGGAALDAVLAETVDEATLKMRSEECAKEIGSDCVFMLDEGLEAGTTHADFGARKIEVFRDVKSLQEAILKFIVRDSFRKLSERDKRDGSTKVRTIHVVLRQHHPIDPPHFEILVPQLKNRKTSVLGLREGADDELASLVATTEGKITKIGLCRDDKLNCRLPVAQGRAFWSSRAVQDMLGRDPAPGSDSEAEVDRLLTQFPGNTKVFGFTLPPADETREMVQLTDRVIRKFGEKNVEFYRDAADLRSQIAGAVGRNESIVLILRPSPKRAMDKVIARQPFPFLTAPSPDAAPVPSEAGNVQAKWFEVLWVWEREEVVDGAGKKVQMLRVGDQEFEGAGKNKTRRTGWVTADNVVSWRGPLTMRFAAQGNRKRVLFWNDRKPLENLLGMPERERAKTLEKIYAGVDAEPEVLPAEVSMAEPVRGADWDKQPYLLPALDFARVGNHGDNMGMLLQTLALKRDVPAVTNRDEQHQVKPFDVDIVFVTDLTNGVGPTIASTRTAIDKLRNNLLENRPEVARRMRFGLWGYRDGYWDEFDEQGNPLDEPRSRLIPGMEFVTRNFTPDLEDAAAFSETLAPAGRQGVKVQDAQVDSIDYAEDMLAGVNDAILKTQWRKDSKRFMILIGDAPGRENGQVDELWLRRHPDKGLLKSEEKMPVPVGKAPAGTASGMNIDQLRAVATSHKIYLASLCLVTPQYDDWFDQVGKSQFSRLAANPGMPNPSFSFVNTRDERAYEGFIHGFLAALAEHVGKAETSPVSPEDMPPDDPGGGCVIGRDLFAQAVRDEMSGPGVMSFNGWVWNRNPGWPGIHESLPLEPCVLISRAELDQVYGMLKDQTNTFKRSTRDDGQWTFMRRIRVIDAWMLTRFSDNLSLDDLETGLTADEIDIPYLRGLLPYESLSLSISAAEWDAMGGCGRADFLHGLESKLTYYKNVRENLDQWHPLRDEDTPHRENWVTLIPLSQLP